MSSGSVVQDDRVTDSNGNRAGQFYSKVWSGGDNVAVRLPKEYAYGRIPVVRKGRPVFVNHRYVIKTKRLKKPLAVPEEQHAYDMSLDMWTEGSVQWIARRLDNGSYVSSGWQANPKLSITETYSVNDDIRLVSKLREKIIGSDFDMGIFFAELPQTLALIGDTAIRINRMYGAVREGNVGKALDVLGVAKSGRKIHSWTPRTAMSDAVLELRYGWAPLLNDVYGGAKAIAHYYDVPKEKRYKATIAVANIGRFISPPYYKVAPTLSWGASGTVRNVNSVTMKSIIAILREGTIPTPLELVDPATMIWEKLPWSFVADWFIPIGSYLSARGLASSLKGTFVTTKYLRTKTGTPVPTLEKDSTYSYTWYNQSPSMYSKVVVKREISTTLAVPLPTVKSLGKIASWTHCENALALLSSTSGRRETWKNVESRPVKNWPDRPFYNWGLSKRS